MHLSSLLTSIVIDFAPSLAKMKFPTETYFSGAWSILFGSLNVVYNAFQPLRKFRDKTGIQSGILTNPILFLPYWKSQYQYYLQCLDTSE